MGKNQFVREQRNQNQNKTLAAPFQLGLSWVMKHITLTQEKAATPGLDSEEL